MLSDGKLTAERVSRTDGHFIVRLMAFPIRRGNLRLGADVTLWRRYSRRERMEYVRWRRRGGRKRSDSGWIGCHGTQL